MSNTDWFYASIQNLRTALSNSAKFQEITGSDNASEALAFIHEWDAAAGATLPMAIVGSIGGRSRTKTSSTGWTTREGPISLYFVHPVAVANQGDPSAAGSAFAAILQQILNELEAQNGAYVNIIEITETHPPEEWDIDSNNGLPRWDAQFAVMVR